MDKYFIYIIIFYIGASAGFLLKWWIESRVSYSGVILVTKEEERTLFSLRLEATPEEFEYKKKVIFRIETPE